MRWYGLQGILCIVALLITVQMQAETWKDFNEFKINVVLNPEKASDYEREFMDKLKKEGTPLIEGNRVTFIYENKSSVDTLPMSIVGDFNEWKEEYDWFIKLPSTKILYKTFEFPIDARLDYQFVIGNEWILDPYNPNTIMSGFGPKPEVNMPGYIEANEIEFDPNIPHGQIIADSIYSEILDETRAFKIYTPASFNYNHKYPSLYVHDGYEFISIARLENVLDNMIYQRRIQPLIAIFIPPIDRFEEYFGEKKYAEFIIEELIPYIDEKYPTIDNQDKRCTAGISAGGTISIALGWNFPEVFGCIISQSGVVYIDDGYNNYLKYFIEQPRKNLRLYVDVGTFEWPWMVETNRLFKSVLDEKNYPNSYMEFNEGHSWGNWRSHIKYGLEYLLGN
ncbi:hypothetical protein KAX02_09950 [candidate division WOR-3 bacterium]|nr:hypothetical protein [candidate division WOR-3 bacterium]